MASLVPLKIKYHRVNDLKGIIGCLDSLLKFVTLLLGDTRGSGEHSEDFKGQEINRRPFDGNV